MSIETEIYTQLSTYSNLVALTGTRVYPIVFPQDVTLPAIVYQNISATYPNSLSGSAALQNSRMQIDIIAGTYAEAKAVAVQVKAAMAAAATYKSLILLEQDLEFQTDTDLAEEQYRVSFDFSTWL